ncbi:MAG: ATP-binding cassette domain-containing protein [Deltaproteobacteria bacterium]|jgi:zinc transport system ATP-binding protein|nr:ATP-binding cassette domain-containing protein [Deltaproteobacteria bacterium]MBT6435540.1 ATP-binding cassette domain-containing protein [Deltaproteobacteria bacterium]MBT6490060.1 ATP-binding cassette domain-containing protein [Deltaproteobacteria bacterium]
MSNSRALEVEGLVVGYQGRGLLPGFNWTVHQKDFWALLGSNGSGKSTIVKTVLGLLDLVGGDISYLTESVGFVPQRTSLDLSVPARAVDVIEAGALQGWNFVNPFYRREIRERLKKVVEATDTNSLLNEQLSNLSEGQKQRVLIARALMSNPKLLVLDEPTSAMDYHAERRILDLLVTLQDELGLAIVMVCHNIALVAEYATHGLLVDREHNLIIDGDIREIAYDDECRDHFGLIIQQVVEERFGITELPEEFR